MVSTCWYFLIGVRVGCHPAVSDAEKAKEIAVNGIRGRYGDIIAREFNNLIDTDGGALRVDGTYVDEHAFLEEWDKEYKNCQSHSVNCYLSLIFNRSLYNPLVLLYGDVWVISDHRPQPLTDMDCSTGCRAEYTEVIVSKRAACVVQVHHVEVVP
jgi:hypothetical protein